MNEQKHRRPPDISFNSPIVQPHTIEIQHAEGLTAVLSSLGIGWAVGRPPNGVPGTIRVQLDREGDFLLEQIISQLSDIRWRYTPGRTLQLALNMHLDADVEDSDGPR